MVLRRVVSVVGIVVILVGLAEIIAPTRMIILSERLMRPDIVRLLSLFELVIGVVLIAAARRRAIGLRTFVCVLGVWLIFVGMVMFAAPHFLIDMVNAILLYRPHGFQMTVLWASALLRIALGAGLLWAALRPPGPDETTSVEHR